MLPGENTPSDSPSANQLPRIAVEHQGAPAMNERPCGTLSQAVLEPVIQSGLSVAQPNFLPGIHVLAHRRSHPLL